MADERVKEGATVKCPKGYVKLTVTVKAKDGTLIKGASVEVKKADEKKAKKKGGACTLTTGSNGIALFSIKKGSYKALAKAENKTKGQTPAKPFIEKGNDAVAIAKDPVSVELVLDPVPLVKLFLKLAFKDAEKPDSQPDERALPLPGGKATLVFDDNSPEQEVTFNAEGMLLGADNNPGLDVDKRKGGFKVKVKKPAAATFVVVEARGEAKEAPTTCVASEVEEKAKTKRVFMLPFQEWELSQSSWTARADGGKWDTAAKKFKELGTAGDTLGAADAPVTLVLDPRWQYARFTYFDRVTTDADQVSVLPQLVSGYALKQAHAPNPAQLTTRSNWTFGADDKAAVQCLPWIIFDSNAAKPDKASELRWTTKANTFIKTADDGKRTLEVGEQKTASAERLAFYDLPPEWRSTNWFVRTKTKGSDITEGKFFFELDTSDKVRATKDKPLIFSLDDIVLYKADGTTPLAPLTSKAAALAVFHHTFAKATDVSDEGVFLAEADVVARDSQDIADARYPASKAEVLGRKTDGTAHAELKENYIVKYPDWTRLVTAAGNMYDTFSERSVAKSGEDRVVGARAAVCWFDATAQIGGKNPVPGQGIARPAAVAKPFTIVQAYVEIANPITRARRDKATASTKGAATTATDLGPLKAARVGRDADRAKEWESDQAGGGGIGRWDLAFLRCCGRDASDKTKELAVLFNYFRLSVKFMPSSTYTDDPKKSAWMKRAVDNMTKRWNGPDGAYNSGRASIVPQQDTPKLKVDVLRFFQMNPDAEADFRFQIIAGTGGRNWMNSWSGLTESSEGKEVAETSGRFTAAHEMGHGGGLLDDYCEIWNFASYYQPGLPALVPGDPYIGDDVDGSESMMLGNKEVRARHSWHITDWLHTMTDLDLHVLHGTGTPTPFVLPHHPRNAKTAKSFRSFLAFPYDTVLDAAIGTNKARFDGYLWALGTDVYSKTILPGKCGTGVAAFDAILIAAVNVGFDFLGTTDHDWIRATTAKLVSLLKSTFSYRCVAKITLGTQVFNRAMIHISPRVIVGTHAGNDAYDGECNAKPVKYEAGKGYERGALVEPSTGVVAHYYTAAYNSDPGPGSSWISTPEPAWPTATGGTVVDGEITWTAIAKADGPKKGYERVIENLVAQNQLHVILQVGAATSEFVTPAGELPRIKIKTKELLDLIKAVEAVGVEVVKVMVKMLARKIELVKEINDLDAEVETLDNTTIPQKKNDEEQKKLALDAKAQELKDLGAKTPENTANFDKLTGEKNALDLEWKALRQKRRDAQAERKQKSKERENKFKKSYTPLDNAYKATMQAQVVVQVLENVVAIADGLFKSQTDPLNDPVYTELKQAKTAVGVAAGQPKPTRATAIAAVTSTTPGSVNPKLKAALSLLPDAETTTAADVSSIATLIEAVALKLHDFAAAGADAPAKASLVRQGRETIKTVHKDALDFRTDVQAKQVSLPSITAHRVDEFHAENTAKAGTTFKTAASSSTVEEQLQKHFATFLGIEVAKGSTVGYDAFAKAFDGAATVSLAAPPPPPPPPITPITPPQVPQTTKEEDEEVPPPPPPEPPENEAPPTNTNVAV